MKFNKSILAITAAAAFTLTPMISASANAAGHTSQSVSTSAQAYTSTVQATSYSSDTATDSTSTAVVNLAKKLASQSIPYVWGGESLQGMDCSGLTDYVYREAAGIQLGHYTVTQESKVTKKAVANAQPGDLLFWGAQGASYHVAIYIGNNQYVAAPQPGQNVSVQTINSAFMPSFAGTVNR